jgi:hypothetical protein
MIRVLCLLGAVSMVSIVACQYKRPNSVIYLGPPTPPTTAHDLGRGDTAWGGRAIVMRSTLTFEFPVVAWSGSGCVRDGAPPEAPSISQWSASASYADAWYPYNHFQQFLLSFTSPRGVTLTPARLDSALARAVVTQVDVAGEPASPVSEHVIGNVAAQIEQATADAHVGWRLRLTIRDKSAVRHFLATNASTIAFGWCQNGRSVAASEAPIHWP